MNRTVFKIILAASAALLLSCKGAEYYPPIKVGSYNIQYPRGGGADYQWDKRLPYTEAIIKEMDLDVFGAQEPYLNQIEDMMLFMSDTYAWSGKTNVKGQEEPYGVHYNPIFYKKDRFDIVDEGMFWLSDTPEIPSKFEDSYSLRICNWVLFRDKITGKEFYHFNCHFDHKGVIARKESSRLITRKISEIAGDAPAFLTGDFNSGQDSEAYGNIVNSGVVVDSYDVAQRRYNSLWHTYNGYDYADSPKENAVRIDHLFVTTGCTKVDSWEIVNSSYEGNYPSDHFPVVIEWSFER